MNNNDFSGIHFAGQMCSLCVRKASSTEYELLEMHQDANNNIIFNEQE